MAPSPSGLVVFGSVNQDITLSLAEFPAPGQTLMAASSRRALGGKGANQAIAAACAGGQVQMVAAVGDDEGGTAALQTLSAAGVDTGSVAQMEGKPTGTAYIYVRGDGENTIVVDTGANAQLRAGAGSDALHRGTSAWALLSLEVPESEAWAFAAAAKASGLRIALNASPAIDRQLDAELVDLLIVNEVEAEAVVGPHWQHVPNPAEALGLPAVVTTRGGDGVLVDERGSARVVIPARPVHVRDTTGCGDAFAGVLLSRLCAGAALCEAAETASRYAGQVATLPGASESYATAFAQLAD